MRGIKIFFFLLIMWILIIIGGGILVVFTSPISIDGYIALGPLQLYYVSIVKACIAISLVIAWIFILSKIKNWIFKKQIKN
jgi:hypothetical protein